MKAYVIEKLIKGPEEMVLRTDVTPPEPKQGEVQIQVKAAGLNFFDTLQVRLYKTRSKCFCSFSYHWEYLDSGSVPVETPIAKNAQGSEFSGIVLKSTVPQYKPGDAVFGASYSFGEIVTAPATSILPKPKNLSFAEAATLYVTYPTSYGGLIVRGQLKAGEYCLVHAAAGGVGLAAVQIAKAVGATVIATAGSAEKLQVAKEYGADIAINYRDADWIDQVKKATNGHGADVVYDPVGLVEESTKCTAWNGRIIVIGFAKGTFEKIPTNRILLKNISVVGLHWGAYTQHEPETIQATWKALFQLLEEKKVRATVYKHVYSLETLPQGLIALNSRQTYGKVVALIGGNDESKL